MNLSLDREELYEYVIKQMESFFPDKHRIKGDDVYRAFNQGLERLENCFQYISFPAYCDQKGQTFFSHLHADQYAQFLYFFSNSLWNISQNKTVCDKLLLLNRTLHSVFISYKGILPDVFFLGHPVGTILGNASYNDFLVVFQNVTVNTSMDDKGMSAPQLGKGLFLAAGAKIIGNKKVGERVSIGVDAVVYDKEIPDDSVVIKNMDGEVLIHNRKKEQCMAQNYFNINIDSGVKNDSSTL